MPIPHVLRVRLQISAGRKVRIIKIDVDRNQSIAQQYQVRGVPTLALFKNGKVVWKQSGVQTKQKIIDVLNQNV